MYVFQMTRAKPEDDEYWNSSKFKAFTFDDDDDEFSRVSSLCFCSQSKARLPQQYDSGESLDFMVH